MNQLILDKSLPEEELAREWNKLNKYNPTDNKISFVGNKILYHYFIEELCKTKRKNKLSLFEIYNTPEELEKLDQQVRKRNRTGTLNVRRFECWRINNGSITFFKPSNAMYLYKKYQATKVLDPTAGWGGRGLGAVSMGLQYTGIDTNINLREPYDKLFGDKITMIWEDCLSVDFSKIDYDFVLTSPPYEDIELYSHMKIHKDFYKDFLVPMIDKCRKYNKGYTAINMSPQMYKKLIKNGYEEAHLTENLKEQKNGKTPDLIYLWSVHKPRL